MKADADLKALEKRLGHGFADKSVLRRALTHASALADAPGEHQPLDTYERLEFLGDRVLGLVIADMLVHHFPAAPEGELSRRLAKLVSGETCAKVAKEMQLSKHLRTGGSIRSGGHATDGVLADACESVIGALYRDGGLDAARRFIDRFWRPRMEMMSGPLRDAKTELQEWAHRSGFGTPVYAETLRSGPDHAPEFEIEVIMEGAAGGRGRGGSKREAEQDAASGVLHREGVWSRE